MSKLSISEVLNLINNDTESVGDFSDIEDTEHSSEDSSENVTMNVYDLNTLPISFVEELESGMSDDQQNVCMVSDSNIDVFMNLESSDIHEMKLDAVVYQNGDFIDKTVTDKLEVTNKVLEIDSNNNNLNILDELSATIEIHEENIIDSEFTTENENNSEVHMSTAEENVIDSEFTAEGELNSEEDVDPNNIINENELPANDTNEVRRGRKRIRDPSTWQKEIRKRKRQSGKEYVTSRGKMIHKKVLTLKKDCQGRCRMKCGHLFTRDDVSVINKHFWSLSDGEKWSYFSHTTEKLENVSKKADSKRKFTYKYYFLKGTQKVQVCKDFYLAVLQVSDKRVRNFYEKLQRADGKEYTDMRGRKTVRRTKVEDLNFVRTHIQSFPRIPSHYCRSSSKKEYLEPGLSIAKMYDMYVQHCNDNDVRPLKKSMYRKIFIEEYNIGFHIPKKDRCDLCEEMKNATACSINEVNDILQQKYSAHETDKKHTKIERDKDRIDKTEAVVCFDLENVIVLPKANVSNFFYKRKLSTFNLTAHCSIDDRANNAIWNEALAGRGANEIASAIVTILRDIKERHNTIKSFILWSDSCVPQNRNSVMCYALKRFMLENSIDSIVQKFCCPGHSSIQEVDNIHSSIEKTLRYAEVYSPVSLIRILKTTRRRNPFQIMLMQKHNYRDYQKSILGLKFNGIPFTKVKCLKYVKSHPLLVEFKLSFADNSYRQAIIGSRVTRMSGPRLSLPVPENLKKIPVISIEKKKDLTSMLKYMSEVDQHFYRAMKLVV